MQAMPAVEMIREGSRAAAALHPMRRRILESLARPDSAAGVARRLGLPRQKVNYHLRLLEGERLVELQEERQVGGCTERVFRPTARAYVIAPDVLGPLTPDPADITDRFSSAYLVAVAAQAIRDLGVLEPVARQAGKRLPTLTLETQVRFASPERQHAFASELVDAVMALARKYSDDEAPDGRSFRFFVGGYPARPEGAAHDTLEGVDA